MHAVSRALYQLLRGGGAVVEGAEFLLTHRHISRQQLPHLGAAALCTLMGAWMGGRLTAVLPAPPTLPFPWFLILVEWIWASLPVVLGAELAAWVAQTVYVTFAPPRQLVSAVLSQRGSGSPSPQAGLSQQTALTWLGAGGLLCALIALVPVVGPVAAAVLAFPVLGGALSATTLSLLGRPRRAVLAFLRTHWGMSAGLGVGLLVALTIPVLNLVALPCAATGIACLLLKDLGLDAFRTSEGTAPCASPNK